MSETPAIVPGMVATVTGQVVDVKGGPDVQWITVEIRAPRENRPTLTPEPTRPDRTLEP